MTGSGCLRGCPSDEPPIHLNPNMDYQEKLQPQESSPFFYDGKAMREPVAGTIARGELKDDSPFFTGIDGDGNLVETVPVEVDADLLARGQDRYGIYCSPCHDRRGEGKGVLSDQGVPVPSLHIDRLRDLPDGHVFRVITEGQGLMPSYRYPLGEQDRWAIVAHVRALQSRRAAREER